MLWPLLALAWRLALLGAAGRRSVDPGSQFNEEGSPCGLPFLFSSYSLEARAAPNDWHLRGASALRILRSLPDLADRYGVTPAG